MSSGAVTGSEADCPKPAPSRATNICRMLCTAPVSRMMTDQIVMVMASNRLRDIRSDSDDIGMAPMTNKTPVAPPMAPKHRVGDVERLLDVGRQDVEHAAVHELQRAQQADDRERAERRRCARRRVSDMASSPTPGRSASASSTSGAIVASARRVSCSKTAAASDATSIAGSAPARRVRSLISSEPQGAMTIGFWSSTGLKVWVAAEYLERNTEVPA